MVLDVRAAVGRRVTALRNQLYSWRYIGTRLRWSSAIGGRKLAEMRGILRHPLRVMYRVLLEWLYHIS